MENGWSRPSARASLLLRDQIVLQALTIQVTLPQRLITDGWMGRCMIQDTAIFRLLICWTATGQLPALLSRRPDLEFGGEGSCNTDARCIAENGNVMALTLRAHVQQQHAWPQAMCAVAHRIDNGGCTPM